MVNIFCENTDIEHVNKRFSQKEGKIFESERAVEAYYIELSGKVNDAVESYT